jgi:hypothetical protein
VPGSSCVPFFDILNEDKTYKTAADIAAAFQVGQVKSTQLFRGRQIGIWSFLSK